MVQSTNGGASWSPPQFVTDSCGGFLFAEALGDTILLGTARDGDYRRFYRTTNAGIVWVPTLPKIIGNDPRIAMTPGAVHRVTGWVFDSAGVWSEFVTQYRKSTDLGDTWSDSVNLSTMSSRAYEPSIGATGFGDSARVLTAWKDVKYGCLTPGFCSVLGRRSISNGSDFEQEQRFDVEPRGAFMTSSITNNLAVIGWSDEFLGVFVRVSCDGGLTWCAPYVISAVGGIQTVAISTSTIHIAWNEFIGGRYRVFYRRGVLLPTSVKENSKTLPPFVRLLQNYPNPFNPRTKIRFEVGGLGFVTLKVYDVLGREVATLLNEEMDAGEHIIDWSAEGLPSGVYYYRIFTARTIETRKAVLIK